MDELMNVPSQGNFDFFQYRNSLITEEEKRKFVSDCQKVVTGALKVREEALKTAWRMAKIKHDGIWKKVINPDDGMTFNYSSFQAFCNHAYGLSPTQTSNLLSVAECVVYDERSDTLTYVRPTYEKMCWSKLVELAPLVEYERAYFRAEMTIPEMRLCKKYIKESDTFYKDRKAQDFDLLTTAQEWEQGKAANLEQRHVQEVDARLQAAEENASESGDSVFFYPDEDDSEDTGIRNSELSEGPTSKYRFTSRDKTLNFLADFATWETLESRNEFFDEVKRYRFRTGAELFAVTCKMCVSAELEDKALLFYFLSPGNGARAIKISKIKLVAWLRAHEAELLGV